MTALALLRHLTNPKILGEAALDGGAAWRVLETWLAVPQITLLDGRLTWTNYWGSGPDSLTCAPGSGPTRILPPSRRRAAVGRWPLTTTFSAYPGLEFLHLRP